MLLTRFIVEHRMNFPNTLRDIAHDPLMFAYSLIDKYETFTQAYDLHFQEVLHGKIAKTAQFWGRYLQMMRMQSMICSAVQENNFEMRLQGWEYWPPLYFSTRMFNYVRYGSYHLQMLKNIDERFPGLKPLMINSTLSVQGQDR